LASMLITWHNLTYYQDLMAGLRAAIADRRLSSHAADLREAFKAGDIASI